MATKTCYPLGQWCASAPGLRDAYGYDIRGLIKPIKDLSNVYGAYVTADRFVDDRLTVNHQLTFTTKDAVATFFSKLTPLSEEKAAAHEARLAKMRFEKPQQFVSLGSGPVLGSDPEVFVTRKDGTIFPAFEFLPAEAQAGKIQFRSVSVCEPYWDGFQCEFKVPTVACLEVMSTNIRYQLKNVLAKAQAIDPKAKLVGNDVLPIPATIMGTAKKQHVELGCSPSQNAYDMGGEKPEDPRDLHYRFAGCHFHMSIPAASQGMIPEIIRQMDNLAGVVSVGVLQGLENPIRRRHYGLAGEYRTPRYGLEYRVLSSAILWHPVLMHLHFGLARAAAAMAMKNFKFWDGSADETVDIINNLNVDQARVAMNRNRDILIGLIRWLGRMNADPMQGAPIRDSSSQVFEGMLLGGISQAIDLDVAKNWCFSKDDTWSDYGRGVGAQAWEFFRDNFKASRSAKG